MESDGMRTSKEKIPKSPFKTPGAAFGFVQSIRALRMRSVKRPKIQTLASDWPKGHQIASEINKN